jgi:protein MAK11
MVKFSPLGTHFAVLYPKKVEIYSLTLKLLKTITGPSRSNTLLFANIPVNEEEAMEVICIGTEKGLIEVYSLEILETEEEEEDEDEDEEDEENGESSKKESGAEVERIGAFGGHANR